ncbi:hypothetical protein NUBL21986_50980 [Klebsiella pneumoniae]|nr:hypothetical protein NUBL21986_50980 [Klebsiella pneumoniae]
MTRGGISKIEYVDMVFPYI